MDRALLVVSARMPSEPRHTPGPRKDYAVLAETLSADVLDQDAIDGSRARPPGQARCSAWPPRRPWLAFTRRADYAVIVTDGEHIGIPLALLLKLARDAHAHVTIGHRSGAPARSGRSSAG